MPETSIEGLVKELRMDANKKKTTNKGNPNPEDLFLKNQADPMTKGIIHKYQGRVLLICNGVCAVHCRYCFRREFDYKESTASKLSWDKSFEYIDNDKSINEVILSGGDPLLLTDQHLNFFIDKVLKITRG